MYMKFNICAYKKQYTTGHKRGLWIVILSSIYARLNFRLDMGMPLQEVEFKFTSYTLNLQVTGLFDRILHLRYNHRIKVS